MALAPVAARLRPFFTLSYPVATPSNPDAFPDSQFYGIGPLDGLFILGWSIVLALLREGTMKIFRPIARRRLLALASRSAAGKEGAGRPANGLHEKVNGNGNGNGQPRALGSSNGNGPSKERAQRRCAQQAAARERKAIRFAEQGWCLVYYCVFWVFGMVRPNSLPRTRYSVIHPRIYAGSISTRRCQHIHSTRPLYGAATLIFP